jgi:glycosyltransferase involved in cell wall biosynthesis
MAAGTPLISTDWPGSGELIAHGETGWLTPTGSAEQLADRIEWLLNHPEEAARVAEAGWRHCRDCYAPDTVGRQTLTLYDDVLARHAARP